MTFASLYAEGRVTSLSVGREGWPHLYHANYYFLVIGGLAYLGLTWTRRRVFIPRAAVDFAAGLALYNALYYTSAHLLIRGWVPNWTSLVPGLLLIAYGLWLRRR